MDWKFYLNFFVAFVSIINPITKIPIWSELTYDVPKNVRYRLSIMVVGVGIITLLLFLVAGKFILLFFSIDLMAFKVAGGILLLTTGIKMLEGTNIGLTNKDDGDGSPLHVAKIRLRKIFVPMVIPFIVGPGSLTIVLLYGAGDNHVIDYAMLSAIITVTLLILNLTLLTSRWLENKRDDIVFSALTRLFGIIVTAIAIQFMLEGLGEVFPNWTDQSSPVNDDKVNINSKQ